MRRLTLSTTRPNRAVASLPPGIEPFFFWWVIIPDHSERAARPRPDGEWKSNQYRIKVHRDHLCEHCPVCLLCRGTKYDDYRQASTHSPEFFEFCPVEIPLTSIPITGDVESEAYAPPVAGSGATSRRHRLTQLASRSIAFPASTMADSSPCHLGQPLESCLDARQDANHEIAIVDTCACVVSSFVQLRFR